VIVIIIKARNGWLQKVFRSHGLIYYSSSSSSSGGS